jgi:hypothetical protein
LERWWNEVGNADHNGRQGTFPVEYAPKEASGLLFKFYARPAYSLIKGVQSFPYIESRVLEISGVTGGYRKLIKFLLGQEDFTIGRFTCLERTDKNNNNQQIIIFIPTEIHIDKTKIGSWVYLMNSEKVQLLRLPGLPEPILNKLVKVV